jgi:hypothetical protein
MATREAALLIVALQSGCSLVIRSDDSTFAESDSSVCSRMGDALYVKPGQIHESGWFSAVVAADENVIVSIAPTEADRPARPGTFDGAFIPDPKVQLPPDIHGAGSVHFFERDSVRWNEVSRLTMLDAEQTWPLIPTTPLASRYDEMILPAFSVAVHAGTVAIGVPGDARASAFRGSVRLFDRRPGGWEERVEPLEEPELDLGSVYGYAVALGADLLAIGAPGVDAAASDTAGPTSDAGAVYLYRRVGGDFIRVDPLRPPQPQLTAMFGSTLALSDGWLVVAAPIEDAYPGMPEYGSPIGDDGVVYAYRRHGAALEPAEVVVPPADYARLGYGASLALLGNTLLVGAPAAAGCLERTASDFFGAVHVFEYSGKWIHRQCIEGPNTGRFFGWRVGLTERTVAIAEPWRHGGDADNPFIVSGGVHLFDRHRFDWSTSCLLEAPNADPHDNFGSSLALTSSFVVVGAPFEDGAGHGRGANARDNENLNTGALYLYAPKDEL